MIKRIVIIVFALALVSPATAESETYPYIFDYLEDVWGTILDNNETGKWNQRVTNTGSTVSTIWRAGCVDDPSVCLQNERIYPSGDIVREFIPLNT